MAAVSVSFDGTQIDAADSTTNWTDLAGGKISLEGDFVYEGNNSISEKVGATEGGIEYNHGSTTDFTTPKVWLAKVIATTSGILNNIGSTGMKLRIGSDSSNYYDYYVAGADTYPIKGGWLIFLIDPNAAEWRENTTGSPALGSVDYWAVAATFTASSKAENLAMDSIDYMNAGKGYTLVGGDGASTDGVFQDFIDQDEGTDRKGVISTLEGVLFVTGMLTIGSSTATVFTDSNKVVVFPNTRTDPGATGMTIDLSNASNNVAFTNIFLESKGVGDAKQFFGTISNIDATNNIITISERTDWGRAQPLLYSKEGGSDSVGMTDATVYYTGTYDAVNGGYPIYSNRTLVTRVTLSAGSTGENHSLLTSPDTRSDYIVSSTTGVAHTNSGGTIVNFRNVTLTSKVTFTGVTIIGCEKLTQGGATLTACKVSAATTEDGEAFILSTDLDTITDSEFTFSNGHAIEYAPTGAGPFTETLDGNTFTGYGATSSNDAALYINPATSTANITINVQNASTPTYRLASGYTGTFTMAQTVTVKVTARDASDSSLITGARVLLEADTGGPLPAGASVTITRSGTTASVSHTAHGMSNGQKVAIRGANEPEYNGVKTISNVSTNAYDYTVSGSPATPATGTITSTAVILDGTTTSGVIQDTGFVYTSNQPVVGVSRRGTATPLYKTSPIQGTITGSGLDTTTFMVPDE